VKLQQGYNTYASDVDRIALTGELNNVQAGDIVIISAKQAACFDGESFELLKSLSKLNASEAGNWLNCDYVPEECAPSSERRFAYAAIIKDGSAVIEKGGCNEEVVKLKHVFEDSTIALGLSDSNRAKTDKTVVKTDAGTTPTTAEQTCITWFCQQDGLLPKSNANVIVGQSDPECCEQSCRDWACPLGHTLKDEPQIRIGASDDACCAQETCQRWNSCSPGKLLAIESGRLGHTDAECCEESCASFTCSRGLILVATAAITAGNTDGECCEAEKTTTASSGLPILEVQQALESANQPASTAAPLPVEVSFIVSAGLNNEDQPQNCDEVCLSRGKPCHDASLQRTLADEDTGRVNVMQAFLAAAFSCNAYDTSCSETGNCAEQGAPFVHRLSMSGSTQWMNGRAEMCYYGNAVANCTLRPNDADHRRLCACEDPEQATRTPTTTTTSDSSFCAGIETPGHLGCDSLLEEHNCENFYMCPSNGQWCNPCVTKHHTSQIGGKCGATAPQCQRPPNPR